MYRELPKLKPSEILVYLRKSRSDDPTLTVDEVLSKHETLLNEWIENNLDEQIPNDNWYREVVSGETIADRPEMQRLLRRIESPDIRAVLVVECVRLGRPDLEEIGRIVKLFKYTNTIILTRYDSFDLTYERDREQFERELMRGNDYLEYTKKILRRGRELSLRSGNFMGVAPYGYRSVFIVDGNRKYPSLEIVEEEAKVVRMIFDWYGNEGIGATRICQRLNEAGYRTRIGHTWTKSSIMNMVYNDHYIGKVAIGRRTEHTVVENQEIRKVCHRNFDCEIVDGKHEAIIDEELFYKIKDRRLNRPKVQIGKELVNPLASLLRCQCGCTMIRRATRGTFRYHCDQQPFCHTPSVKDTDLYEALRDALIENVENIEADMKDADDTLYIKHQEYISMLESRLVEYEKKELSLWEKYTEDKMPKNIFDNLMQKCLDEKESVESALRKAKSEMPQKVDYNDAIVTLHQAIDMLCDDTIPATPKNKLLLSVVESITYNRGTPIRMTSEEAKAKGLKTRNGWYSPDFTLDIKLKI